MRALIFAIAAASFGVPAVPLAAKPPVPPAVIVAKGPNLVPIASRMAKGTISVRNTGTVAAGPFKVTVACATKCADPAPADLAAYTDAAFPDKVTVSVPGLSPGHVYNHKIEFWDSLVWRSGNYEFTVVVDAANTVAETNEADNSGGTVFGVP
jgi:CARDB